MSNPHLQCRDKPKTNKNKIYGINQSEIQAFSRKRQEGHRILQDNPPARSPPAKDRLPRVMAGMGQRRIDGEKSKDIPLSVISEGMGHDSEETTRIYLASLDTSVVDEANSKVINSI